MEVIEIVKRYLTEEGCNGLCHLDMGCSCSLDDLAHCGDMSIFCEAMIKTDTGFITEDEYTRKS